MNKFKKECLKDRIFRLATLKCTGRPADLALKFEISERSVKRLIKEMRDEGRSISFNQIRRTYVTGEDF